MTPTREALLQAATDELAECGHAGISLRAVARRAGVSHAAPKNHFGDRAGLLTAVAARGFTRLAAILDEVSGDDDDADRLSGLGAAYVGFGLTNPALFDLMWRPVELRADDPDLVAAQTASLSALVDAVARLAVPGLSESTLTVMAWAFVHGLVVLARDGALAPFADLHRDPADLAREVVTAFARTVSPGGSPPAPPVSGSPR